MNFSKVGLSLMVLGVLAASNAFATKWTNNGGTGSCLWNDSLNWDSGLPTSSSSASVDTRVNAPGWTTIGDVVVAAGATANAWHLDMGEDGWREATVTVNGTLNTTQIMEGYYEQNSDPVGHNVGNVGILNVNAGAVINNSDTVIVGREGNGIVNMNGGTLNTPGLTVADGSHSTSTIYLNAGLINVTWEFTMTSFFCSDGHGTGSVIINNGTLKMVNDGSTLSKINGYISSNWIKASAGKTLNVANDGVGHIVVTAVPEPLTMSLLALGGLLISRRRS